MRTRPEDIKDLVLYHTARLCESYGLGPKGFAPEFIQVLSAYDWPGNVRELVNTLDMALAAARHEPTLFPKHLPSKMRIQLARALVGKGSLSQSVTAETASPGAGLPKLRVYRDAAVNLGGKAVSAKPDDYGGRKHQRGLPDIRSLAAPSLRPPETA